MTTIYLRFSDRAEALAALGATLGYASSAPEPGGPEQVPLGWRDGLRYDLCFLADQGLVTEGEGDLVNLLWWGEGASAPDFGACQVVPVTPRCGFAL
jgi:hypothetical protein